MLDMASKGFQLKTQSKEINDEVKCKRLDLIDFDASCW
jgi:hypothetical protein